MMATAATLITRVLFRMVGYFKRDRKEKSQYCYRAVFWGYVFNKIKPLLIGLTYPIYMFSKF